MSYHSSQNKQHAWDLTQQIVTLYTSLPIDRRPVGFWFARKRVIQAWVTKTVTGIFSSCGNQYKSIVSTIVIAVVIRLVVYFATKMILKWLDNRDANGQSAPFQTTEMPIEFAERFDRELLTEFEKHR